MTITDIHGDFHFLDLFPGAYSLTLERSGFAAVRHEDVLVSLGQNTVLRVTMSLATAEEAITVSGESALPDARKSDTGSAFHERELRQIPTARDVWSVLRMVPGVLVDRVAVGGNESSFLAPFVGKGSHADQNTFTLDGVAIGEPGGGTPVFFDFDSLQGIEAATGGSDPLLSTPGVAVNLVTKQGTNELKGSGRFFYTDGFLDYGLEAGGPIWKDRIWLWGAFARNDFRGDTLSLPPGEGTYRLVSNLTYWNAKLNAQPLAGNSLTLFYLDFQLPRMGRGAGPDRSLETSWDQSYRAAAYKAEDSQVFSSKLFASAYFSYLSSDLTLTPEGGMDKQALIDEHGVWRNTYVFFASPWPQHQAGLTGSAFFDTGSLKHELKFGFGYKHVNTSSLTVWPGDEIFGDELSGLAGITRTGNPRGLTNYYDVYAGDAIQTGNLTVNAGLRFDYQQGKNLASSVSANPVFPELLPAASYGGDSSYPITWRSVQPRVGLAYAPGADRTTLVRASYSRFTNQLGLEVASINAFPGAAYLYYGWQDTNGSHRVERSEVDLSDPQGYFNVNPSDPASGVAVNQIDPNLEPPETDEFIVGVERQIFSDLSASLAYTHRSSRNLMFPTSPPGAQPLVGVTSNDYRYFGNAAGTATASNGFTLGFSEPYYGLTACPDPCAGVRIENRRDYSETYNGLELQVLKRLSHGWSLRIGFAYNDWTKSVGPGAIVNPNNLLGGSNATGAVAEPSPDVIRKPQVFINAKWQLNVSGTVQVPLGIELGANFFARQGYVLPYFVEVVTRDIADNRPSIQIGKIDDYRLGNVYQLDLQLQRPFRIGSRLTTTVSVACFNLFNRRTVLQRVIDVGIYNSQEEPTFTPNPSFNEIAERQGSRTFRVGVRVAF